MSPPTRFGEKYRDEIIAAPRDHPRHPRQPRRPPALDDLGTVTTGVFRSYGGRRAAGFTVTARAFALCIGGLENARTAAQLPQPGAERHRQRPRPRRPLLLRPAGRRHRRPPPRRADRPTRSDYFTPTRGLLRRAGPRPLRALDRAARRTPAGELPEPRSAARQPASPPRSHAWSTRLRDRRLDLLLRRPRRIRHPQRSRGATRSPSSASSLEQRLNPDSRVTPLPTRPTPSASAASELDWQLTADDYHTMRDRDRRLRRPPRRAGHRPAQAPRLAARRRSRALPELGSGQGMIARAPAHVHDPDERRSRHRRRRYRLPRARHRQPLHRRLERLRRPRASPSRPSPSSSSRCGSATTSASSLTV